MSLHDLLPKEIQTHIWSFLTPTELLPLRATCRTMQYEINMHVSRTWLSNVKIDSLKSALAMCWPMSRQLGPVIGACARGNSVWFHCVETIDNTILANCTRQLEWHVMMDVSSLLQANLVMRKMTSE